MASLETTGSRHYHIIFRFQGQRFKRALKTREQGEANTRLARLEETIRLVEAGRIELPEAVDVPKYLLSDGKLAHTATTSATAPRQRAHKI